MKIFGTDGIRGIAWNGIMEDTVLTKILHTVVNTLHPRSIVVGRDTRESSKGISYIINRELPYRSIQIYNLGIVSTPMVSFYTTHLKADLGIMITASHNPYQYNGLKFFDSSGYKLSDSIIEEIEYNFDHYKDYSVTSPYIPPIHLTNYNDYLSSLPRPTFDSIIIDPANGSLFDIVHRVFPNCTFINDNPNGCNINPDFTPSDKLKIRFDGDGDRMTFSYNNKLYDGDDFLYMMYKAHNYKKIIGTEFSNSALPNLIISPVGDKYLVQTLIEQNADMGCEPNGHCVCRGDRTGDGLLNALRLLEIFDINLLNDFNKLPQYSINVPIMERKDLASLNIPPSDNRVVIRYSGTEDILRIMVEGDKSYFDRLVRIVYRWIGI